MGRSGCEGGNKRLYVYISLHCHHQNDSCIKMGSDESHFNVSLIVRDKVTRQCPQNTAFEKKGEPKRFRNRSLCFPLPLGQIGSRESQDGHLDFLTAPELCFRLSIAWQLLILHSCSFLLKYIITAWCNDRQEPWSRRKSEAIPAIKTLPTKAFTSVWYTAREPAWFVIWLPKLAALNPY